jgi:hypothetical protein
VELPRSIIYWWANLNCCRSLSHGLLIVLSLLCIMQCQIGLSSYWVLTLVWPLLFYLFMVASDLKIMLNKSQILACVRPIIYTSTSICNTSVLIFYTMRTCTSGNLIWRHPCNTCSDNLAVKFVYFLDFDLYNSTIKVIGICLGCILMLCQHYTVCNTRKSNKKLVSCSHAWNHL